MEYAGVAWEFWGFANMVRGWAEWLADQLGITSTSARIAIDVLLIVLALVLVWVCFKFVLKPVKKFIKRLLEKKQENPSEAKAKDEINPKDIQAELQNKLIEMHELVSFKAEVPHTISMREGQDKLHFEWLSKILVGKECKVHLTGSIEARFDLSSAGVKVNPSKFAMFEEIIVNVSMPKGYFIANFDITDAEEVINTAGWFNNRYTLADIQDAFNEQYASVVRERIEEENMITKAKDTARADIKGSLKGFMDDLGLKDVRLKDLISAKKYEVVVTFTGSGWKVFKGAKKGKPIDEVIDQQ